MITFKYQVGDKIETLIGGKWLPGVITKPPHKETKNYGVRLKHAGRIINTVSSLEQLKHVKEEIVSESTFKISFKEFLLSEKKKKKDPCWKGYKQIGTKDKDGKTVPNCVPEELTEKVHTIRNSAIGKMGAPADKARAFDKVHGGTGKRPNRSVLKKIEKANSLDQDYKTVEISEDPDYTMVLVAGGETEPYLSTGEEYYGVNVLFYPNGQIAGSTADSAADWQWKNHRAKIVSAARVGLKKHNVDVTRKDDRRQDYHGYTDPKMNEAKDGKLTSSQIETLVQAASTGSRVMADGKILYAGVESINFNSPAAKALWATKGKEFKKALTGIFKYVEIKDFDEKKSGGSWLPGEEYKL